MRPGWSVVAAFAAVLLIAGLFILAKETDDPGSLPARTASYSGPRFVTTQCADVIVLGARGSGQNPHKNLGLGQEIFRSVSALADHLHARSTATIRVDPVEYVAIGTGSLAQYDASVASGVRALGKQFDALAAECTKSQFGFVGFSQGAQVVHEYAARLDRKRAARIGVVGLIADPHRATDDHIRLWSYNQPKPEQQGSLPNGPRFNSAMSARAITFCVRGDEVCNRTRPPGSSAVSQMHKHFYETPEHSHSTGEQLDRMLTRK